MPSYATLVTLNICDGCVEAFVKPCLVSVGDIWRSLPMDQLIRAKWWRVPVGEVPRSADHEAQVQWLFQWWERIDTWISQNRPDDAADPALAYRTQPPAP